MTKEEWVKLARRRVLKVLEARRFASLRQLEKKISEAGPASMRAEPIKISLAIKELLNEELISQESLSPLPKFFKPANFGGDADQARRSAIIDLTTRFLRLAHTPQLCGKALEHIVYAAVPTQRFTVLGTPEHSPREGFAINGYVLERECDHILVPKDFTGPKLVVEDKNLREWLHPSAEEVWSETIPNRGQNFERFWNFPFGSSESTSSFQLPALTDRCFLLGSGCCGRNERRRGLPAPRLDSRHQPDDLATAVGPQ
jgi:hypothetical protein